MDSKNFYAVVMAGGRGERFWPQSRASRPKQMLRLLGSLTLIEQTVARLHPLIPRENILVITNNDYVGPMRSLLTNLPPENIIGEPFGRDTGPCVAMAAGMVRNLCGNNEKAVMIMLPSDQMIDNCEAMRQVLSDAGETAANNSKIVTIGINPTYASTGYGYIKCGAPIQSESQTRFFHSLGFKEKPNVETAERMLSEGNYRWNSGIFIWSLGSITNAFERYAPALNEMAKAIAAACAEDRLQETMLEEYRKSAKISIDYAVMEKLPPEDMCVAESTFGWDDVGSWNSLRNQLKPDGNNNVVRGLFQGVDVHNSIIVGESDHLIAAVDVQDLVIVHTDDATLVCNAKSSQRIKELVALISKNPELEKFV